LTAVDDADVKSTSGEINEEGGGGVNVGYSNENKLMMNTLRSTNCCSFIQNL
jgi:hypothetical protein